jgi:hypothetical protein
MIKGDIHGEQSKPLGVVFRGFSEKLFRKTIQKTSLLRTARTVQIAVNIVLSKAKNVSFPVTIIIF